MRVSHQHLPKRSYCHAKLLNDSFDLGLVQGKLWIRRLHNDGQRQQLVSKNALQFITNSDEADSIAPSKPYIKYSIDRPPKNVGATSYMCYLHMILTMFEMMLWPVSNSLMTDPKSEHVSNGESRSNKTRLPLSRLQGGGFTTILGVFHNLHRLVSFLTMYLFSTLTCPATHAPIDVPRLLFSKSGTRSQKHCQYTKTGIVVDMIWSILVPMLQAEMVPFMSQEDLLPQHIHRYYIVNSN